MKRLCVFAGVLCIAPVLLWAADPPNTWLLRGPYGGYADAVAIDPATDDVVAGGYSGVFRYPSSGTPDSWSYSNVGAPTPFTAEFATTSTTLYQNSGGYIARWDTIDASTTPPTKAWVVKNAAPLPPGQTSSIPLCRRNAKGYATSYGVSTIAATTRRNWAATASQPAGWTLCWCASPTTPI